MAKTRKRASAKSGKKTARRRRRKAGGSRLRTILRVSLIALLVGSVLAALYTVYLDYRIRDQFEGKRWALPARVYARPLELYAGLNLAQKELVAELKQLHYRPVKRVGSPGTFSVKGSQVEIRTRQFTFWDGSEPERHVRIRIGGGVVQQIRDLDSREGVPLLRLDPVLFASIYPAHNEDRILVKLDQVPETLLKALLAVEDRQFYQHSGVDIRAIARALWANLRAGRAVQGGSTLTQQLVKNYFLSNKRSLWRKLNEAIMAMLLEWHYDKQEILEAYLNEVYLGQDGQRAVHGFGLASRFYFQRPLKRLSLHQFALLVGLVKGASFYDPRRFPKRAKKRRDLVLEQMTLQGHISDAQAGIAKQKPLGVTAATPGSISRYPAFLDLVRRQLRRDYRDEDLMSEGLRIFTTFDPIIQARAEQDFRKSVDWLERQHRIEDKQLQGAAVITDVQQGEIVAMIGGRDPKFAGFNRALDAIRQVGSLVKPATYLAALQSGDYTLASILQDQPIELLNEDGSIWSPNNYDKLFRDTVPLFAGLVYSLNVPSIRLGMEVGLDTVSETLNQLGIIRPLKAYPSMLLGAIAMSPLEMAQAYYTIAAGGFYSPLRSIRAVLDNSGEPLQRYALTVQAQFDPVPIYLLNATLQQVGRIGTARSLAWSFPDELGLAGKTGTTDDLRDSWFAGYSGNFLTVVWLGRDDNGSMGLTGATGALRVWSRIMSHLKLIPFQPDLPEGIEYFWIDQKSGLLSAQGCEGAVQLPFIIGTEPDQEADCLSDEVDLFNDYE